MTNKNNDKKSNINANTDITYHKKNINENNTMPTNYVKAPYENPNKNNDTKRKDAKTPPNNNNHSKSYNKGENNKNGSKNHKGYNNGGNNKKAPHNSKGYNNGTNKQHGYTNSTKKGINSHNKNINNTSKKTLIEIIDSLLSKNKKLINRLLLIVLIISSVKIIKNITYNGDEIKSIKKENKTIEKEISELSKENKSLEDKLEKLSSNNSKLNDTFNTMVDENFKALPGTTWSGNIKPREGQQENIPVSLAIKDDEIILTANGLYWYLSDENEAENYINAQISLSSGEKNKEKGYMKLNRLSFKNPPAGFEEYDINNVLPYNYDIFFNDTYATGYLLDGYNNIKGTISLKMSE